MFKTNTIFMKWLKYQWSHLPKLILSIILYTLLFRVPPSFQWLMKFDGRTNKTYNPIILRFIRTAPFPCIWLRHNRDQYWDQNKVSQHTFLPFKDWRKHFNRNIKKFLFDQWVDCQTTNYNIFSQCIGMCVQPYCSSNCMVNLNPLSKMFQ